MSKASEWTKQRNLLLLSIKLPVTHPLGHGVAMVERNGALYIELTHQLAGGAVAVGHSMTAEDALAFAAWILDVFGAGPPA